MTVRELFKHFGFYFSRIVFYDKTNNIHDTAFIFDIKNRKKTVKTEADFLNEYGDYKVNTWEVDTDLTTITNVYISIEIEEEQRND